MLLNLASIIHTPGGIVPFSFSMDFTDAKFGGAYPAQEPVLVSGQVRNEAGVLLLSAKMETTLHCVCDRCAAPFLCPYAQQVTAVLVTELAHEENEDDWTFLLNLDSKMLCSPDCKGLCARCGKNLNEGSCDCKKELDPRLAVLGQLLKDKE